MKWLISGRLFLAASATSIIFLLFTAQKPEIKGQASYFNDTSNDKPTQTLLNINNITSWHYYDGMSGINPDRNSGVIYPRSSHPDQYIAFTAPAGKDSVTLYLAVRFNEHRITEKRSFPLREWYPDPVQGEELEVVAISGFADHLTTIVADPTLLTGHTYEITFFESANNELRWRLTDRTNAETKLNNAPLVDRPHFPHPVGGRHPVSTS